MKRYVKEAVSLFDFSSVYDAVDYYSTTIQLYFEKAHEMANIILWSCLLFEIIFIALGMILGKYMTLSSIIKKILTLGVWIYIAQNIDHLALVFSDTLQRMSGNITSYNFDYLQNPLDLFAFAQKEIFVHFIEEIKTMFDVSFLNILKIIVPALFTIIALVCFTICILVIVVFLCLVKLEFYFILLVAILLVPFNMNEHTQFIGSKALSVAFFQGVRILSISLVTGLVIESFKNTISEAMTVDEITFILLLTLIIHVTLGLYLILQSGKIIQVFMPGGATGTAPLQQMTSLAISAFTGYNTVMGAKSMMDKVGSKAKSALPSAQSRGSSNSQSKDNNIPTLQNRARMSHEAQKFSSR